MQSIKVICIDDANKPKEIPQEKWVIKGETYHISHIFKQLLQPGIQGVELVEFDISMHEPYNCYRLTRFAFRPEDISKFVEMMNDCANLNDIDIQKLTKELITIEEPELA